MTTNRHPVGSCGGTHAHTGCACPVARGNRSTAESAVDLAVTDEATNSLDWDDPTQVDELLNHAQRVSRKYAASSGTTVHSMEVDDLAQEAILAVLERRAKGEYKNIQNTFGYLNHTARNIASRGGRSVRSADLSAMRQYKEWHSAYSQAHGHDPSTTECDEAAARIREEWRPANWDGVSRVDTRPSPHFRENVQGWERTRSNNMTEEVFDNVVSLDGTAAVSNYAEPGSALDVALSHMEDLDENGKPIGNSRSGRKLAWNAIAESVDAPKIDEPHLGHRAVSFAYATVTEDNFLDAVEDARNGVKSPLTDALLSPWRNHDDDDQVRALDAFDQHPSYAYDLWTSAVTASARPRKSSTVPA